jgi:uncharacterized protein (TIGR03084 family)
VDDVIDGLTQQQDQLAALLDGLGDDDWTRPSRCEGWTVADVVLHLAQTNEMAVASVHGAFGETVERLSAGLAPATSVDEAVDGMVALERGTPHTALRERWRASAVEQAAALAGAGASRRVQWVAGDLTVRTLATTRLAETWIHGGDVAAAFGTAPPVTGALRHVARLAWRMLPYAFGQAGRTLSGPVAFELRGPDGDTWSFTPDEEPATTIRGDGVDLCLVAARRVPPEGTTLTGEGPDAGAVLALVRTYA